MAVQKQRLRRLALIATAAIALTPLGSPGRASTTGSGGDPHIIPTGTVYDGDRHVVWLANGNLARSQKFGVAHINADGSMDYATALNWVKAMNHYNRGAGYLGHHDWSLPTTPTLDESCSSRNVNTFGFNCKYSMLGSLYYSFLGLHEPNTAVPMQHTKTGPFKNFQPYLYWSSTQASKYQNGYSTFSFDTGFQGSNVSLNHLYVLPMIRGQVRGLPAGTTVYDSKAKVTWLADADLAATQKFKTPGIDADGSMEHTTAVRFVKAMNAAKYLKQIHWELPHTNLPDGTCSDQQKFGYGCTGSPMGALYYEFLKLPKGQPVVTIPNAKVGPFYNIQPYLYWSCEGELGSAKCESAQPSHGFEWSFSFGNGFTGTDVVDNTFYVMVYYPAGG